MATERTLTNGRSGPGLGGAEPSPPTIRALTGVRAVAALWVLLGHLVYILVEVLPGTTVVSPWFSRGALGVDIFFVLSGFVISYNYAERMATRGPGGYRTFLWARFARVYPVHLVTMVACGLFFGWLIRKGIPSPAIQSPVQGAGNLLLLQALPGFVSWNPPAWSISCEAAAYALFPFAAALLTRTSRPAAVIGATVVLALEIAAVFLVGWTDTSQFPVSWIRIAGGFTVGCLLWAAWRGSRARLAWDFVAVAAVGATVLYINRSPQGADSFLVLPLLALFVVAAAGSAGPVRAVLASRPMEWGGRISYSLYLTHFVLLFFISKWIFRPEDYAGAALTTRLLVIAGYCAIVLAVAAATYYLVEEPARRWLRARADRAPAVTAPTG